MIDLLSLDTELTKIFRIRWDFHNLKVLMKCNYLENPINEDSLVRSGLFAIDDMQEVVESKADSVGPSLEDQMHIIDALKEAAEFFYVAFRYKLNATVIFHNLHFLSRAEMHGLSYCFWYNNLIFW